jgi:hypothetical protein
MARTISDPLYYSLAFFLAFVVSVVMLVTDKNLQTDFGVVTSGYYLHWYLLLGTAILDLVGALVLVFVRSRTVFKLGTIVSGLLAVFLVGAVFTYSQVGFPSAGDMANYLFGVTYYGGDIRYLYDLLLLVYVATFLFGVVALLLTRQRHAPAASWKDAPSGPS